MENQSLAFASASYPGITELITRIKNKETKIIYDKDPDGSFSAYTLCSDSFYGELIAVSHGNAFKEFDFTTSLSKGQAYEDCKTLVILDHEISEADLLSIDSKLPSTVEEILIVDHHPKTMEMVKATMVTHRVTHSVVLELLSTSFTLIGLPSGRRITVVTPAFNDKPYSTSHLCNILLFRCDPRYSLRVKNPRSINTILLKSMIDTYDTWTFIQRGVSKDDVAAIKGLVSHLFLNGDMYFNPENLISAYRSLIDNLDHDIKSFKTEFETTIQRCKNVVKKYMSKVSFEKGEHKGKKFGIIFHSDHIDIVADEALQSDDDLLFVAIVYMKPNGCVKCSLRVRSESGIDLLPTVSRFGGGGHAKACGIEFKADNLNHFLYRVLPNL